MNKTKALIILSVVAVAAILGTTLTVFASDYENESSNPCQELHRRGFLAELTDEQRAELKAKVQEFRAEIKAMLEDWGVEVPEFQDRTYARRGFKHHYPHFTDDTLPGLLAQPGAAFLRANQENINVDIGIRRRVALLLDDYLHTCRLCCKHDGAPTRRDSRWAVQPTAILRVSRTL